MEAKQYKLRCACCDSIPGVNQNRSDQRTATTIQDQYSTIGVSTDPQTEQNESYGQIIDTSRQSEIYSYPSNPFIVEYDYPKTVMPYDLSCHDYYVNEGMGGPAEMRMTENKAYIKTREPQPLEPIAEDETYIHMEVSSASAVEEETDYDSIKFTTNFQIFCV